MIHQHILPLLSKPIFGMTTGILGTLLTYIGILTPLLGFITVVIGLVAAIYSLIHQRNQVLKDEREK